MNLNTKTKEQAETKHKLWNELSFGHFIKQKQWDRAMKIRLHFAVIWWHSGIMKKLYLLLVTLVVTSTSAMASTDDKRLQQAEAWLQGLDQAISKFQQIDHQGNVMRGRFYIDRPGRLRFEYDEPTRDFIVADGFQIHFYDSDSDQFNSAPIGSTLADFILRDDVSFSDDKVKVESIRDVGDMLNITVSQADEPGMGELVLKFNATSYQLMSWDIIDAQGLTTSIVLDGLDKSAQINPSIFKVDNRNLNE